MYETQVKNIAPEEARRLHEEGVPFIDVREVEEYAQARIPGSSLLPGLWSSTAARETAPGRRPGWPRWATTRC